MDRYNRAVAYHFYDEHPHDTMIGGGVSSTQIPAYRVQHNCRRPRISASRGDGMYGAMIQSACDLDSFVVATLTAARTHACASLEVNRKDATTPAMGMSTADTGRGTDEAGNVPIRMGHGNVIMTTGDDSVKIHSATQPGPNAEPFVKLLWMLQAMSCGLSYTSLTGDSKRASYSSIRADRLQDSAFAAPMQFAFGRACCLPVRQAHTEQAVALGRIRSVSLTEYRANPWRYGAFDLLPPGSEQLDGRIETDAAAGRMRICVSTLKKECGRLGLSWRKVILQRKREDAFAAKHGVTLDFSKGQGANVAADGNTDVGTTDADDDDEASESLPQDLEIALREREG
jgi:capsid protein